MYYILYSIWNAMYVQCALLQDCIRLKVHFWFDWNTKQPNQPAEWHSNVNVNVKGEHNNKIESQSATVSYAHFSNLNTNSLTEIIMMIKAVKKLKIKK